MLYRKGPCLLIYPIGEKTVYIGTDKGLYVSDARGTSVKRLSLAPRNPTYAWQQYCKWAPASILVDQKVCGNGLALERGSRSATPWAKALGTKFITEMKQAPDGAIWMATLQDGLYRYDLNTQALLNIKPDAKSKASLPS